MKKSILSFGLLLTLLHQIKHKLLKPLRRNFLYRDDISRPRSNKRWLPTVITTATPIALARQQRQRMQCPICIFHTFRWSLRLVHILLLAMIDDIAVLLRLLLLRIDHRVLVAHLVQILLLIWLFIRIISSPHDTRLVMRPLGT